MKVQNRVDVTIGGTQHSITVWEDEGRCDFVTFLTSMMLTPGQIQVSDLGEPMPPGAELQDIFVSIRGLRLKVGSFYSDRSEEVARFINRYFVVAFHEYQPDIWPAIKPSSTEN